MLPIKWFVLCFLPILVCFSYNYSYHLHKYYASVMNTVLIQSIHLVISCEIPSSMHLAIIFNLISRRNAVNDMDEGNIPMHDITFCFVWDTKILYNISSYIFVHFSLRTCYGEIFLPTGSSSFKTIFWGVYLQP